MARASQVLLAIATGLPLVACHRASSSPGSSPPPAVPIAATSDAAVPYRPLDLPKIDVHVHVDDPGALPRAISLLGAQGIRHFVNLSGSWPGGGLEESLEAAAENGHVTVFCNLDFRLAAKPGYGKAMVAQLEEAHALGAKGLKVYKGLGLGYRGPDGQLLHVDDPELGQVFERAGELGMPVTIHVGDPQAFWQAPTPDNERYDELSVHPHWSYYGEPVPSWEELYAEFGRLVAAHPRTIFIGAHFGNDPEEPERVAAMMDQDPNLYVDTAARVPELGRHPADAMRELYVREQDRVMFGTDTAVGREDDQLMLGSTGATPPGPADITLFYGSSFRYFETTDRQFASPTPIQGRWKIDGVGLPRDVLEKIYFRNAARLLGVPLSELGVSAQP